MWADRGECKNSKQYMMDHCKASCKYCTEKGPRPKDEVEQHPLTVASISAEVGVTPAPAGSDVPPAKDAAAVDAEAEAAKQKAAADKAAADKAAMKKAAADKAAAAAAAAAEAAKAAKEAADKAATKAVDGPGEEEMRGKYPVSTMSYAVLVKRWVCRLDVGSPGSRLHVVFVPTLPGDSMLA